MCLSLIWNRMKQHRHSTWQNECVRMRSHCQVCWNLLACLCVRSFDNNRLIKSCSVSWTSKSIEDRRTALLTVFSNHNANSTKAQNFSIHRFNEMCIYLHSILALHHMKCECVWDLIKMSYSNNDGLPMRCLYHGRGRCQTCLASFLGWCAPHWIRTDLTRPHQSIAVACLGICNNLHAHLVGR